MKGKINTNYNAICFSNINGAQKSSNTFGYIMLLRRLALALLFLISFCMPSWAQSITYLPIGSVDDLLTLRNGINSGAAFIYKGNNVPAGGANTYFKLTANLDLSDVCGANVGNWTPIGTYVDGANNKPFKGHFNGDGHSISNLYINAPGYNFYQGLFGFVNGGSIDSLNLVNTDIIVMGGENAGTVAGGISNAIIRYCTNSGSISGSAFVGGIAGYITNSSKISHCTNSGSVSGIADCIGGVCAYSDNSTISHCTNSGSISGEIGVGGVCGVNCESATIINCSNSGSVSGTDDYVGGVCGINREYSKINCSTNSGSVSGNWGVGGLCGDNDESTISHCYYDKQMCTVGGIGSSDVSIGSDVAGEAEGKLTTEMTGIALQDLLDTTNWTFADGMYPRPKGIENTDAAIVAATPIFLAATNTTTYETVDNVATNFTYSGADTTAWSSTLIYITFSNGHVSINQTDSGIITATYGNANKSIAIKILNPITVSISDIDEVEYKAYPTPVIDRVTAEGGQMRTVTVVDSRGRKVESVRNNDREDGRLSTGRLSTGRLSTGRLSTGRLPTGRLPTRHRD